MRRVTLLILLSSTVSLLADECNVNSLNDARFQNRIRREVDNGANLGPTRDQDSVGWWYAYAAADMTEQWLKNKGLMPMGQKLPAGQVGSI